MTDSATQARDAAREAQGEIAPAPKRGEPVPAGTDTYLSRVGAERRELQAIVDSIPETGEDAELNMILTVLQAERPEDVGAPWDASGLLDYQDKPITITGIRKSKSDYPGGWGFFLLLECVDNANGRRFVLTTGSSMVVAQCVKLHAMDAWPVTVIPRVKITASGTTACHLEPVRA